MCQTVSNGAHGRMHDRLMASYSEACRRRLQLWLGDEVSVEREGLELIGRYRGGVVRLGFVPSQCTWWMEFEGERQTGTFDRLTKSLRQIFTAQDHGRNFAG